MNLKAFLTNKTGPLPNWAWIGVIVVGMGIGIFVMKRQSDAVNSATTDTTDMGAATVPSGEPNYTIAPPAQNYAPPGSNGHEVIVVPLGNAYVPPSQPVQRVAEPKHEIPPKQIATVRNRYATPTVKEYDDKNPGGVPVRSTPGGSEMRKQPYASTVEISGPPVTGASNFAGTSSNSLNGSTSWYPLATGGYISSYDITGVSQQYNSTNTVVSTNTQTS